MFVTISSIRKINYWGDILLYVGIIFILLGAYSILCDIFDVNILLSEKTVVKKESPNIDEYFKLKLVVGIFAIIVGILSIANYLLF